MAIKLKWQRDELGRYHASHGVYGFTITKRKTADGPRWRLCSGTDFITIDNLKACKMRAGRWLEQELHIAAEQEEASRQGAVRLHRETADQKVTKGEFQDRVLCDLAEWCKDAAAADGGDGMGRFQSVDAAVVGFVEHMVDLYRDVMAPAPGQCGSCGAYHPPGYDGDCRNDAARFGTPEEAAAEHVCPLCEAPVLPGEEYVDGDYGRAHKGCSDEELGKAFGGNADWPPGAPKYK